MKQNNFDTVHSLFNLYVWKLDVLDQSALVATSNSTTEKIFKANNSVVPEQTRRLWKLINVQFDCFTPDFA